ncbi:MAG: PQQ-binding-like beta-propeller repeat protein [Alphaproteobacteria bacterium]
MRGLGGPFVGVGSAVLIAAAGFYYFAPTSWISSRRTARLGGRRRDRSDRDPGGPCRPHLSAGTPAAAGAESATRRGVTTGTPSPADAEQLAKASAVTEARIAAADAEPGNWMAHGRTTDEQRFSPLDQINRDTVASLGVAWEMETGTVRGLEASPIVIDGTMFVSLSWSVVKAIDARTGRELWTYDPEVPGGGRATPAAASSIAASRSIRAASMCASLDGRLIALDARTGKPDWVVNTLIDHAGPMSSPAPRASPRAWC